MSYYKQIFAAKILNNHLFERDCQWETIKELDLLAPSRPWRSVMQAIRLERWCFEPISGQKTGLVPELQTEKQ